LIINLVAPRGRLPADDGNRKNHSQQQGDEQENDQLCGKAVAHEDIPLVVVSTLRREKLMLRGDSRSDARPAAG